MGFRPYDDSEADTLLKVFSKATYHNLFDADEEGPWEWRESDQEEFFSTINDIMSEYGRNIGPTAQLELTTSDLEAIIDMMDEAIKPDDRTPELKSLVRFIMKELSNADDS